MNSRIYLQPDAVPTQAMIRTANRLFRHFGKEITFLQQPENPETFPDITMNRLKWAMADLSPLTEAYEAAARKAPNLVLDLTDVPDAASLKASFTASFEADDSVANLVIIEPGEVITELAKPDQTKSKRK